MSNLFDSQQFPAAEFGDLYHRRWRIEEAFKRLKHRLNLEHVSGLSQLAAMQDFAAKIVCDNIASLTTQEAADAVTTPSTRRVNRAYAFTALKAHMPALLLHGADMVATILSDLIALIARKTYFYRPGRSSPRKKQDKPHKNMNQKPC
jgi:Transposase DDE domain